MVKPLILTVLFPLMFISFFMIKSSSKSSFKPNSSSISSVLDPMLVNTPSMIAFVQPFLTILVDARSPRSKPIASINNDLPAPVSPVIAVKPSLKSILMLSIMAKFLTVKLSNIFFTYNFL